MTTPNFGWPLIQPTDLVTDLPADFEAFADAVDADLDGLNGGTTGQVLTKASATDYDFAFADAGGFTGDNFTLLNAGGTALTGADTITVSGISNKDKIVVLVSEAAANAFSNISIRVNTNSGAIYHRFGHFGSFPTVYNSAGYGPVSGASGSTAITLADMANNTDSRVSGAVSFRGCANAGVKVFQHVGGSSRGSGVSHSQYSTQGYVDLSATITSISVVSGSGNFSNGTVFVFVN